jgi:hypothetical protein
MVRGGSMNQKATVSTTNTGSKTSNALQNHSKYPNDFGQPSQKGPDAAMETPSQMTVSNPKKRVHGLPKISRVIQPPHSTIFKCGFMFFALPKKISTKALDLGSCILTSDSCKKNRIITRS